MKPAAFEYHAPGTVDEAVTLLSEFGLATVADLHAVPADVQGSAAYRTRVGATVVQRAWNRAVEEALNG